MKFAVLYSKEDTAGMNIAKQLKNYFIPQAVIIELTKDSIHSKNIDEKDARLKNVDFIIFATKHKSEAGTPSLSVHAPGNWRSADFGGKPGKVCRTSALALKFLFQKLNENAKTIGLKGYDITLECTHHGPLIKKPCAFIEIGSSGEQWKNPELGKIIAKTIADFQTFKTNRKIKTAIAVGGPHYCPNFNKIQLSSNYAISHIIPEYALPVTEQMLEQAIEKTQERVDLILLDWKGCGKAGQRQEIIRLLDKIGLKHERTERIEK